MQCRMHRGPNIYTSKYQTLHQTEKWHLLMSYNGKNISFDYTDSRCKFVYRDIMDTPSIDGTRGSVCTTIRRAIYRTQEASA
jgi:hypothetical protein